MSPSTIDLYLNLCIGLTKYNNLLTLYTFSFYKVKIAIPITDKQSDFPSNPTLPRNNELI